jgi:hypothetical protein
MSYLELRGAWKIANLGNYWGEEINADRAFFFMQLTLTLEPRHNSHALR